MVTRDLPRRESPYSLVGPPGPPFTGPSQIFQEVEDQVGHKCERGCAVGAKVEAVTLAEFRAGRVRVRARPLVRVGPQVQGAHVDDWHAPRKDVERERIEARVMDILILVPVRVRGQDLRRPEPRRHVCAAWQRRRAAAGWIQRFPRKQRPREAPQARRHVPKRGDIRRFGPLDRPVRSRAKNCDISGASLET